MHDTNPGVTIEVSLQPDLQQFVAEKVQAGQYASAGELVCELLRLLRDHEEALLPTELAGMAKFRRKIAVGVKQLDRGEAIDVDGGSLQAFFEDIKTRGRSRLGTKRPEV